MRYLPDPKDGISPHNLRRRKPPPGGAIQGRSLHPWDQPLPRSTRTPFEDTVTDPSSKSSTLNSADNDDPSKTPSTIVQSTLRATVVEDATEDLASNPSHHLRFSQAISIP
ncbi:hypothetical protein KM043_003693 [Ampulex compressa]|nr:hypothetical protein KM043_003693 [Ampulex compressa]